MTVEFFGIEIDEQNTSGKQSMFFRFIGKESRQEGKKNSQSRNAPVNRPFVITFRFRNNQLCAGESCHLCLEILGF